MIRAYESRLDLPPPRPALLPAPPLRSLLAPCPDPGRQDNKHGRLMLLFDWITGLVTVYAIQEDQAPRLSQPKNYSCSGPMKWRPVRSS